MSETAEGRKEAHEIMINDVHSRMDSLIATLPESEKARCSQLFDAAFVKICRLGNGNLFAFFADDEISNMNFVRYCDDLINARLLF